MQVPMHSPGESNTHPSTPCSASIEWGGNRSTLIALVADAFCRRAFFKSGGVLPVSVSRESIMLEGHWTLRAQAIRSYYFLLPNSSQFDSTKSQRKS